MATKRTIPSAPVDVDRLAGLKTQPPRDLVGRLQGVLSKAPHASRDGDLMFWEAVLPPDEIYHPPNQTHFLVARRDITVSGAVCLASGLHHVGSSTEGSVTIIPAGEPFYTRFTAPHRALLISLRPKALYQSVAFTRSVCDAQAQLQARVEVPDPVIVSIGLAMQALARSASPACPSFFDAAASALAVHLVKHYSGDRQRLTEQLPARNVASVLAHLNANIGQKFQVEELARIAGYSPFHFCRLFTAITGATPMRYVLKLRMQRARELIQSTSINITEVASIVGFDSVAHFSRAFRSYWNIAPSELRRRP